MNLRAVSKTPMQMQKRGKSRGIRSVLENKPTGDFWIMLPGKNTQVRFARGDDAKRGARKRLQDIAEVIARIKRHDE